MTPQDRAKDHRERLRKSIDDMACTETCLDIFDRALHAERAKVWEETAKAFDKKFYVTDRRLDNTRDYRVDEFYKYCREQAQKEQP